MALEADHPELLIPGVIEHLFTDVVLGVDLYTSLAHFWKRGGSFVAQVSVRRRER